MRRTGLIGAALMLGVLGGLESPMAAPAPRRAFVPFDPEREQREREAANVFSAERMTAAEAKRARKNAKRAAQFNSAA